MHFGCQRLSAAILIEIIAEWRTGESRWVKSRSWAEWTESHTGCDVADQYGSFAMKYTRAMLSLPLLLLLAARRSLRPTPS